MSRKVCSFIKTTIFFGIIAILLFACLYFAKPAVDVESYLTFDAEPYTVERVIDGDTILVNIDGVDTKVRLIGIDTPESVHSDDSRNTTNGSIASEVTKSLLQGKSIALEYDAEKYDKYDRLLAYVYVDDIMVNDYLVSEGYAQTMTIEPNTKYEEILKYHEEQAREENKGFWDNGTFVI